MPLAFVKLRDFRKVSALNSCMNFFIHIIITYFFCNYSNKNSKTDELSLSFSSLFYFLNNHFFKFTYKR